MRRLALFGALTNKLAEGKIKIISDLKPVEPKTRKMVEILRNLELSNTLLVLPEKIQNVILSARNIEGVDVMEGRLLNTYEILAHQTILFMKEALPVLSGHFLGKEDRRKDILQEDVKTPKARKKKETSKPKRETVKKKIEKKTK